MNLKFVRTLFLFAMFLPVVCHSQISISGLSNRTIYQDQVSFTVTPQAGTVDFAWLNGLSFDVSQQVTINRPDFYELLIQRSNTVTSSLTASLVRFIVADSSRGGAEYGLPTHVPMPVIPSAAAEFAGAHLEVMAPRVFPAGYEIPLLAWSLNEDGHAIPANGWLAAEGHPSIQLRRGMGSGFLAATNAVGDLNYAPSLQGLAAQKTITIEASTTWTTLAGVVTEDTTFPTNSRIHVTGNVTVPAGLTLRIGAGSVVRLNSRVDITNNGTVVIEGTVSEPVVFMPTVRNQPWGGFIMRQGSGEINGSGVIFTGSGAEPSWFGANGNPGSHRREQALFYVQQNQRVELENAGAIHLAGQLGHAVAGGTFRLHRFLMQRTTTGGEFTGANFSVTDSAFIECPADNATFVDGDNDALYLVSGTHGFTNTLFGWVKDDGIDSGGDGVGRLHYENCWFEAAFHEGNSLSGLKNTSARGTVYYNCGQGLEDGYGAGSGGPTGRVDHCLFVANLAGVRHGDNYVSIGNGYPGILAATNSIFLDNHRDVFGFNWRSTGWTNATGQMFITANFLTKPDPYFPQNAVWNPAEDAWRLGAFGAGGRVGAGFAVRAEQTNLALLPDGLPVALSMVCTNEVQIDYLIESTEAGAWTGTLTFTAGQVRRFLSVPPLNGVVRVTLTAGRNADLTGMTEVQYQRFVSVPAINFVSYGSSWKYLDDGSNQGTAWRGPEFDDAGWSTGGAELGLGDGDEATVLRRTNSAGGVIITYYFRKTIQVADLSGVASLQMRVLRDDGAVVYVNGAEVFRSANMPAAPAPITFSTLATATGEDSVDTVALPVSLLQPGANTLAVEIHQQATSSSDVSFDFELTGQVPTPQVRLDISRFRDGVVLYWMDGSYSLESSAEPRSTVWEAIPGASPISLAPSSDARFFRLRK